MNIFEEENALVLRLAVNLIEVVEVILIQKGLEILAEVAALVPRLVVNLMEVVEVGWAG